MSFLLHNAEFATSMQALCMCDVYAQFVILGSD
jgi:hypothetical protein